MKKATLLLAILVILVSLVSGCSKNAPEFPQELVFQGGQPYLDNIWITYTKSYDTASQSNLHTVSLFIPEDMPMTYLYASLIAQSPDGSQVDLLESEPFVAGEYYIIENIEQYDALGLYVELQWNGQTLARRSEDLLYPSEDLMERSGYTP